MPKRRRQQCKYLSEQWQSCNHLITNTLRYPFPYFLKPTLLYSKSGCFVPQNPCLCNAKVQPSPFKKIIFTKQTLGWLFYMCIYSRLKAIVSGRKTTVFCLFIDSHCHLLQLQSRWQMQGLVHWFRIPLFYGLLVLQRNYIYRCK